MRTLLVVCLLFWSLSPAWAEPGGKSYKEGKAAYEAGSYTEALTLFESAVRENPERYNGKGNYMIALCYKKMDACTKAAPYFKKAYQADPQQGGASSIDKFKEQLDYCQLTIESLQNVSEEAVPANPPAASENQTAENTTASRSQTPQKPASGGMNWIWIGLSAIALGGGGFLLYKRLQQSKTQATSEESYVSEQLYSVSEILFDDALWIGYAQQHGEQAVQQTRMNWQMEYATLVNNRDQVGVNQLLRKIRQMETSPATVFNDERPG